MSVSSTNSAMTGYHRGTSPQLDVSKAFSNIENKLELKPNSIVRVPNGPNRYITGRVLVVLDRYFTVCINERTLTALCVFREDWSEVELLPETCLQFTEKKTVASATN